MVTTYEAFTAFEMAYRLRHDPVFLFNIAQCQRQLHRYPDAERSYRAYLREDSDLPDSTREQAQKLIREMERAQEEERSKQPPTGVQAPSVTQPSFEAAVAQSLLGSGLLPAEWATSRTRSRGPRRAHPRRP